MSEYHASPYPDNVDSASQYRVNHNHNPCYISQVAYNVYNFDW